MLARPESCARCSARRRRRPGPARLPTGRTSAAPRTKGRRPARARAEGSEASRGRDDFRLDAIAEHEIVAEGVRLVALEGRRMRVEARRGGAHEQPKRYFISGGWTLVSSSMVAGADVRVAGADDGGLVERVGVGDDEGADLRGQQGEKKRGQRGGGAAVLGQDSFVFSAISVHETPWVCVMCVTRTGRPATSARTCSRVQ